MWEWFNLHFGAGDTSQLDPNAPTFRATTDCPSPWPGLIVAFALGAILFYRPRR